MSHKIKISERVFSYEWSNSFLTLLWIHTFTKETIFILGRNAKAKDSQNTKLVESTRVLKKFERLNSKKEKRNNLTRMPCFVTSRMFDYDSYGMWWSMEPWRMKSNREKLRKSSKSDARVVESSSEVIFENSRPLFPKFLFLIKKK